MATRTTRGLIAPGILAALLLAAAPALAVPITLSFEGYVSLVDDAGYDPAFFTSNGVDIGSAVSGSYTFESTGPDWNPDPNSGHYPFESGTLQIGTFSTALQLHALTTIIVANLPHLDTYAVLGADMATVPAGIDFGSFSIELRDPNATAFDSDALPTTALDLSQFDASGSPFRTWALAALYLDGPGFVSIEIELTAINNPEPGTGLMLGLGLILLGQHARRSRT